jgi:hypothetical protein
MAMAEVLLERMHGEAFALTVDALQPIYQWFTQATESHATHREFSAEIKAGVDVGAGIPGLAKLFGGFTSAFKTGSSQKSEWRLQIRNHFTSLASAFNQLIRAAESELNRVGRAERILFILDGTDKMHGEDTQQFFVQDAEQLLAIEALVIYTAPLDLKFNGRLGGKLDADMVLPMIKLQERDGSRCDAGWVALTDLLLRRADSSLFASDAEIARLVEFSGGHPRDLLRILKICCELADDLIDAACVESAIKKLAADFRYFLKPEDYTALKAIDDDPAHGGNDELAQNLLHHLALLQYNDGEWRRSHPVVRRLEGYRLAQKKSADRQSGPITESSA